MADILLQRNDEAYRRVETVAEQFAQRLQFDYVRWDGPIDWFVANNSAGLSKPAGRLARAFPHAFGLFSVQEDVRLFLRTEMSMKLLQEHIKENMFDKLEVEDGQIFIEHEQLVQQGLALPNSLELVIQRLDFREVTSHMDNEILTATYLKRISQEHGPIVGERVSTLYRSTYLQVRDWAYRVGILSSDCSFISEELLAEYYTHGFVERSEDVLQLASSPGHEYELFHSIVKSSSFARLSTEGHNIRGNNRRSTKSQIPQQHRIAIEKAIEMAGPPSDGVDKWWIDALDEFTTEHFAFVKVESSCWDLQHQTKLAQHRFIQMVRELVERIQERFNREAAAPGYATTIFPELSMPDNPLGRFTFLIGLTGPADTSKHNRQANLAKDVAEDAIEPFRAETRHIQTDYCIIAPPNLRGRLENKRAVMLKTTAGLRTHLDYIPIIDPLGEREGLDEQTAATSKPQAQETKKFRTSREVLNRLQWDTKHASNRYEVGYRDRFEKALVWKPLEDWIKDNKDQQGEEFVPMHRIHQFRDISSKSVVWDRDKRIDQT